MAKPTIEAKHLKLSYSFIRNILLACRDQQKRAYWCRVVRAKALAWCKAQKNKIPEVTFNDHIDAEIFHAVDMETRHFFWRLFNEFGAQS